MRSELASDYAGSFLLPQLVFDVCIRNVGDTAAVLSHDNFHVGLFAFLNGEDIGWTDVPETTGHERLAPGEDLCVSHRVAQGFAPGNTIVFEVDNSFGSNMHDYTLYGAVEESDESNNERSYSFDLDACWESDSKADPNSRGKLVFLDQTIRDECSEKFPGNTKEYWCEDDFKIGYGYRSCGSHGCNAGVCNGEHDPDPEICRIIDVPECDGKIVPVYEGRCIVSYRCIEEPDQDDPDCNGCRPNGKCLPYGTRLIMEQTPMYCGITGLQQQTPLGATCQNDYECESNSCRSGTCVDIAQELEEQRSMLQKIIDWLSRIFG